jgi:hypothetical protein
VYLTLGLVVPHVWSTIEHSIASLGRSNIWQCHDSTINIEVNDGGRLSRIGVPGADGLINCCCSDGAGTRKSHGGPV